MKTGAHPFVSKLKLFFQWGISFTDDKYIIADKGARKVSYVSKDFLEAEMQKRYPCNQGINAKIGTSSVGGINMQEQYHDCKDEQPKSIRTEWEVRQISYYAKLYRNDELSPRAKLVYIYLHDRMDQENKAWPSIHTIAKDLSISRSTVKRAIKDLEKAELIRKESHYCHNGSATSNRYYLL